MLNAATGANELTASILEASVLAAALGINAAQPVQQQVKLHPGTALWTYRLFSFGETRTPEFGRGHFLIARVGNSLTSGLQAQLSGTGLTISSNDLLIELAQAGLTLGDEFLRTGRAAEGALGQYLVEYLMWQPAGDKASLPHWTVDSSGDVSSCGLGKQCFLPCSTYAYASYISLRNTILMQQDRRRSW